MQKQVTKWARCYELGICKYAAGDDKVCKLAGICLSKSRDLVKASRNVRGLASVCEQHWDYPSAAGCILNKMPGPTPENDEPMTMTLLPANTALVR